MQAVYAEQGLTNAGRLTARRVHRSGRYGCAKDNDPSAKLSASECAARPALVIAPGAAIVSNLVISSSLMNVVAWRE